MDYNFIESKNILNDIFTTQTDRNNFTDVYKTFFYRLIGCENEPKLNDSLALIKNKLKNYEKKSLLFTTTIPVPYDPELVKAIMEELKNMNLNNLANEDINLNDDISVNERIKKALAFVVNLAISQEKFSNENIRNNFIVKLMIWLSIYLDDISFDNDETPKCIYYGDISKHECYFLIILALTGFDVLFINPKEDTIFDKVETAKLSKVIKYPSTADIVSFDERANKGVYVETVTTYAKKATDELLDTLYSDTGFYKPWQFRNGTTKPIMMNSVIEDLLTYWDEPSKLRPGFKVEGKTVTVPVFLNKIDGINSNKAEYYDLVNNLRSSKHRLFIYGTDLSTPCYSKQDLFSLAFIRNSDGTIDRAKCKKHSLYSLSAFKEEIQEFLLSKLEETLFFRGLYKEPLSKDQEVKLIATVFTLKDKYVNLVDAYDYTSSIPKIIIYTPDREVFNIESVLLVGFLNRIGFDITIFCPSGSSNIEQGLSQDFINFIRLEELSFDLDINEIHEANLNRNKNENKKSFFKKFFN